MVSTKRKKARGLGVLAGLFMVTLRESYCLVKTELAPSSTQEELLYDTVQLLIVIVKFSSNDATNDSSGLLYGQKI